MKTSEDDMSRGVMVNHGAVSAKFVGIATGSTGGKLRAYVRTYDEKIDTTTQRALMLIDLI